MAKQQKKKISFTYSDSFCVDRHFDDFISLAKNSIDILFCNEAEALRATNSTRIEDAFRIMREWCDTVCITIGAKGALLSQKTSKAVEEIPTWEVKLIDKLGAGDLFASGVLYGLTHKKNLRESGFLGCYAATRIIQQVSARLSVSLKPHISEACQGPHPSQQAIAV
jgi:sugar/nucleoside kinase (ribokinase family)